MYDYVVHRRITLREHHKPTGKTRHRSGFIIDGELVKGEDLPAPHALMVAQLPPDDGFYLLYLDESGEEITDTYHSSLEGALDQATWEFEVKHDEWDAA